MAQLGTGAFEQAILNSSFNPVTGLLQVETMGTDGQGSATQNSDNLQIKVVESGGYTYFCFASPGTAEATAKWRIFRLDATGNLLFADANASYDNVATDPTSLSYSYS